MNKYLLATLISFLLIFSCGLFDLDVGEEIDVKYEVTGSAPSVRINIQNENGVERIFERVTLPWDHEFKITLDANDSFLFYVSAFNFSTFTGSITTTIFTNGSIYKTSTGTGTGVVSASGVMLGREF